MGRRVRIRLPPAPSQANSKPRRRPLGARHFGEFLPQGDLDLITAFNAEDGRGRGIRVTNGGQLAAAIEVALANHNGPTLIECIIDRDDCSADLISWGRRVAIANARPPRPQ